MRVVGNGGGGVWGAAGAARGGKGGAGGGRPPGPAGGARAPPPPPAVTDDPHDDVPIGCGVLPGPSLAAGGERRGGPGVLLRIATTHLHSPHDGRRDPSTFEGSPV